MSKVRNFAELAPNIGFSEFDFYDLYRSTFEKSELGRMKKLLPLHAMEGSFGTQKEHYDLRRVKARTNLTEILYIFFGIHTANMVQLADRIEQRTQLAASCKRKYVHGEVLSQGNYGSVIENGQKIRPKRPE